MRLKKQIIPILISLIVLIVTISIRLILRPEYTTLSEIPWYMYLFFFFDLICFALFFFPAINLSDLKIKDKTIRISSIIASIFVLAGIGMVTFALIPMGAYVATPVNNSIEEVERFLSEYKIIEFGTDLLINGLITIFITAVLWFLFLGIYQSITEKDHLGDQ